MLANLVAHIAKKCIVDEVLDYGVLVAMWEVSLRSMRKWNIHIRLGGGIVVCIFLEHLGVE